MALITVKNLNGTSQTAKCSEGAFWIDHWKNYMHYSRALCSRKGCMHPAEVGGHVKIDQSEEKAEYIVPLCKECNNRSSEEPYQVNENLLVPVSHENWPAGKTCTKE